jgi:hypothetical protein
MISSKRLIGERIGERKRRGNVAILAAVCLVPLMGILALVLDGGMIMDNRRQLQTGADMAALAAVTDMFTNYLTNHGLDPNGTAKQSALSNAQSNGFNNDGTTNTVTVNVSPAVYQGGEWKGQPIPKGYAEVMITYQQPGYFSKIWSKDGTKITTRAVARGTWQPASPSIHILGTDDSGKALHVDDSPTVHTDRDVHTNSQDRSSRDTGEGRGNLRTEGRFNFSDDGADGGTYQNGNGNRDPNILNNGVPATPDPLGLLPPPSQPDIAKTKDGFLVNNLNWTGDNSYGATNGTLTLKPGTYPGGISASGGSIVLQPGVYYMTGSGLSLSGNASISVSGPSSPDTGTGVLLYHTPTIGPLSSLSPDQMAIMLVTTTMSLLPGGG